MLNKKSQESSVEFNRVLFADDILRIIGKAQNPAGSDASRILRYYHPLIIFCVKFVKNTWKITEK